MINKKKRTEQNRKVFQNKKEIKYKLKTITQWVRNTGGKKGKNHKATLRNTGNNTLMSGKSDTLFHIVYIGGKKKPGQ